MSSSDPSETATDGAGLPRDSAWGPWQLTVVFSPDPAWDGRDLPVDGTLTLGRLAAPDVDLAVDDRFLSRRHVTISRDGPSWRVVDHASKNGLFVAGRRVTGEAPLAVGDIVRAGNTFLQLGRAVVGDTPLPPDPALVGRTVAHRRVLHLIRAVAPSALPVLVQGETGTGKELVARRIHEVSGRRGALVAVNCATIPAQLAESYLFGHRRGAFTGATSDAPGCIKQADRGTLFLDELGELPPQLQPKLLRVLETGHFTPLGATRAEPCDVRVVAATNVDLEAAVTDGRFRMDLYARLAGFNLYLPPLRERRADVPLLVTHFLDALCPGPRPELEPELMERLILGDWPMNVRQLRTTLERMLILAAGRTPLTLAALVDQLPHDRAAAPQAHHGPGPGELRELLAHFRGNVAHLAKHLGKDRTQVYRWLKRCELRPEDFRGDGEGDTG